MLVDEESGTRWDHITGDAFDGPLKGHRLDWWPVTLTTARAAGAERSDVRVLISDFRSVKQALTGLALSTAAGSRIDGKGFLPPLFKMTMHAPVDDRLPRLTQGLGVVDDDRAVFYPMADVPDGGLVDDWGGRSLRVDRGAIDKVPRAAWVDGAEPPMQLLLRWYGFSFTWPECRIWDADD